VPEPDPEIQRRRIVLEGAPPSAAQLPRGCPFATRCPRKIGVICDNIKPPEQVVGDNHRIACHIPAAELVALQTAGPPSVEAAEAGTAP